jgi:hypothetical protein
MLLKMSNKKAGCSYLRISVASSSKKMRNALFVIMVIMKTKT